MSVVVIQGEAFDNLLPKDAVFHLSKLKIADIQLMSQTQNVISLGHTAPRYCVINMFMMIYDHTKLIGSVCGAYYRPHGHLTDWC